MLSGCQLNLVGSLSFARLFCLVKAGCRDTKHGIFFDVRGGVLYIQASGGYKAAKRDRIMLDATKLKDAQGIYTCPALSEGSKPDFHCCLELKETQVLHQVRAHHFCVSSVDFMFFHTTSIQRAKMASLYSGCKPIASHIVHCRGSWQLAVSWSPCRSSHCYFSLLLQSGTACPARLPSP